MYLSGEKPEDYRELTNYWLKRLTGDYIVDQNDCKDDLTDVVIHATIMQNADIISPYFFKFDYVIFSHGYKKDRDQFKAEFKGIEISTGNPKWGADPKKKYFVIKIGKIYG